MIKLTQCDELECERQGIEVRLRCPAGRPDATACYCVEHGGQPRARAQAERDWNYAAPASVGDAEAVLEAGLDCLRTPEAYVVLRQSSVESGSTWLAWLGLGSLLTTVENPAPRVRLRANGQPRRRGGRYYSGRNGAAAFASRELAHSAALVAWRVRLDARVETIRRERGGTLGWGVPVEPLDAPIVILLEQGETRSAWDLAVRLATRSRAGQSALTGLRPSGECA